MAFRIDYEAKCMFGRPDFGMGGAIRRKKPLIGRLETALEMARQTNKIGYAGEIARAIEISKLLDRKLDCAIEDGRDLTLRQVAEVLALDTRDIGKKIYLAIKCGRADSIRSLVRCGGNLKLVPWRYRNISYSGTDAGCAAVCAMAPLEIFKALQEMGVNLDDALALATRVGKEREFHVKILTNREQIRYQLGHLKIAWTEELIEKIKGMDTGILEIENEGSRYKYILEKDCSTGEAAIYDTDYYRLITDLRSLGAKDSGKYYFD